MFSWGEDWQQGFRLKKASTSPTADGLRSLNLSFHIKDLSAGRSLLAFVKSGGDPFIIRTVPSEAGGSVRSKQKFVKCNEKIEAVSCGDDAVALLSESGKLLCVDTTRIPFTPSTPEALSNIPVSHIACGDHHTVVLTKDGQLYTWGQNSKGQLGLGTGESSVNSPQHVRSLSAIPLVQVAAGGEQSFALSVSGGVFSWGGNHHGQLGLGDTQDRHSPTLVNNLNMKKTVSVSCGKDHTAILTKDGVVFTFGSGQYGQLGHNSLQDELRPRLVAELWGSKVTKIACGSYHTLVLTDSKKVYSFGCNDQGQLGRGEKSHPSVPLPVQLPHDTNNFYAGGNSSFSTCTSNEDVNNGSNGVTQRCIENMIDKWISECDFKSQKTLKQEIHQMFNSSFCMNQSFLDRSKDKHFQTSPKYSGLDLSLAQHSFNKLVKSNVAYEEVEAGVLEMLPCLDRKPVSVEGLRIFMLLSELLRASQKHKLKQSMRLADAIAATLQTLSDESLQILGDWWSSLSPSSMVRHVQVWKEALSQILSSNPVSHNSEARNILLILQYMYNANKRNKKIPETAFSFQINQTFLAGDLQRWRTRDVAQLPLILHTFQFVMDLKSKKMAFDMNAQWTQNEHQGPPQMDFIFPYGWVPRLEPSFFELRLQRASLLEGTFRQLAAAPPSTFKKPLMVYLDGDPKRTDVYKRDVFHHLFHKIVRAKPEMFMLNESKTLAWFPSNATEEDERNFFLLGFLCGLALYNKSIIHLPFPLVLFKKLLNVEATLEDMMEFSPLTARVLQNILNYDDEVLDDLYLDFSITWDGTEVDLDPQNPGKPLTSQNKKEYVEAYINHAFNTSVEGVFKEFRRGFFQVCNQDLVKLFRPDELQGVLVGQDIYDWKKFKLNTVYEWGLHNHFIMKWFWEVFDELTEEQKKDFFRFLTGYRRVPILGMGQIQMKVRVKQIESSSYDQHLPESLTCHSILELPLYSTKAIMRDRLTEALTADTGFTL